MAHKVIVVGAGMAGLAAAQALHGLGVEVHVLERDTRAGGRVRSLPFHGRTIELGAQFPSTGYRHMPALLAQAGLATRACSPWAAIERDGRWHRIHQDRPLSVWTSGLLDAAQTARLAWGALAAQRSAGADGADYVAFAPLDDEDALAWASRTLGAVAARVLFEPSVHGFYFHPLAGSSRALLQALLTFRGARALAVEGGWDTLPRVMARGLAVHTGVRVSAVRAAGRGVQVDADGECLHADAAIVATPSPVALGLVQTPSSPEQALLHTRYAAAVHVALGFAAGWKLPGELNGVHGLLLGSHALVASMVVAQSRLPCAAPEVLTVMLGDATARRVEALADDDVVREVLAWLHDRWSGLPDGVVAHHVHRWACAEPLSPPGRARAVNHYRDTLPAQRRILLCGDGTGLPWTDGAVDSGRWAAARVAERLS